MISENLCYFYNNRGKDIRFYLQLEIIKSTSDAASKNL